MMCDKGLKERAELRFFFFSLKDLIETSVEETANAFPMFKIMNFEKNCF